MADHTMDQKKASYGMISREQRRTLWVTLLAEWVTRTHTRTHTHTHTCHPYTEALPTTHNASAS